MPCFTADHDTCARLQDIIESEPVLELRIDVAEAAIQAGEETIQLEIQSGAQGSVFGWLMGRSCRSVGKFSRGKASGL